MKFRNNPKKPEILAEGKQRKNYLYVGWIVDASLSDQWLETINIGNNYWITVKETTDIVVKAVNLVNIEYEYKPVTRDDRGWLRVC